MKLVLLLVVLIAAFAANCRELLDPHHLIEASTVEKWGSLPTAVTHESTVEDHNIQSGSEGTDQSLNENGFQQQDKDVKEEAGIGVDPIELRGRRNKKFFYKLAESLKQIILNIKQLQNNVTDSNMDLEKELKNIGEYQVNITDSNQDLKDNLISVMKNNTNSLQSNLTNSNKHFKKELQNITDSNQDLKDELKSVMKNITNTNTELHMLQKTIIAGNIKLEANVSSLWNATSIILSKLNALTAKIVRCPAGFFQPNGSGQCFKIFKDVTRTWDKAKQKCQDEGLMLATPAPEITVDLRENLLRIYGDKSWAWVDAKGNGSKMIWQKTMTEFRENSLLHNSLSGSTSRCLLLLVGTTDRNSRPNGPYDDHSCTSTSYYALCEAR